MRRLYIPRKFTDESTNIIAVATQICREFAEQGYDLTLRQLYYQFVARDYLVNTERSYKRLGSIINDARLAGLLDWDFIVDRTRNLRDLSHWEEPEQLIEAAARQFRMDRWADQDHRIEVWIEKDALVGVLETACPGLDVPYFSCRGYTSQSEMWGAAQRLGQYIEDGKHVRIIHLGDHDPSGIDMSRDIEERLATFIAVDAFHREIERGASNASARVYARQCVDVFKVRRIALTMEQIEQYNPPPNPAKLSDARARKYIEEYGASSWELDALSPATLTQLIEETVFRYRDVDRWDEATTREEDEREILTAASRRWGEVKQFLS